MEGAKAGKGASAKMAFKKKNKGGHKRKLDDSREEAANHKQSWKGKRKKSDLDEQEDELTLDLVKELGGDEEDLELLKNIESLDAEESKGSMSGPELSSNDQNELKNLIKSLNLSKYAQQATFVKDKDGQDEKEKDKKTQKEETKKEGKKDKKNKKPEDEGSSTSKQDPEESEQIQDNEISSTTASSEPTAGAKGAGKPEFHFLKVAPSRGHCIVKTTEKWYDLAPVDEAADKSSSKANNDSINLAYWLPKIEKYTQQVWDLEKANYEKKGGGGVDKSERDWIRTVLRSGTLTDRMSAYVLLLQQAPIHNLHLLENLINSVSLKSRRPCLMAIDTLQNLFLTELLIETRKLRQFDKNPFWRLSELSGGNKDTRDKYLLLWMFEDRLQKMYMKFLENLEVVGKDTIEKTRIKVISCICQLLAGNPEQEQLLLERLVNKLGDPLRSVAAKAMYHLGLLLEQHPAMKDVIVREVERLLYRPNISPKAQYYGICFLSQILLQKINSSNLANKLIKIYFSFFKLTVKKGEVESKLMSALLTGVNRAFPYSELKGGELDEQLETMHKLVHIGSFNTSVQTLSLIFQILDSRDNVTDRYYSALYRKIIDPGFSGSSKQVIFINLLYNSMLKDLSVPRVRSFIKRLLQICEYLPANVICGVLFLIGEVIRGRSDLTSIHSVLSQTVSGDATVDLSKFDDDDEEEHYEDVKEDADGDRQPAEDDVSEEQANDDANKSDEKTPGSSWNFARLAKTTEGPGRSRPDGYDPQCRNPLYAGAERCPLWELERLENHFHPSVSLFAKTLSSGENIKYTGDPLNDLTLAKFLDRFVFRNPKKDPSKNKPTTVLGKRNIYRPSGVKAVAPDSKDYLNRDIHSIPGDELFLYKYFKVKAERKGDEDKDDVGSVTSEEFNNFLDNFGSSKRIKEDFGSEDEEEDDINFADGIGDEQQADDDEIDEDLGNVEDSDGDDNDADKRDDGDNDSADDDSQDDDSDGGLLDGEDSDGFQSLEDSDVEEEEEEKVKPKKKSGKKDQVLMDDEDDFDEEGFDMGGSDDDDDDDGDQVHQPAASKKKKKGADMRLTELKKNKKKKSFKFDPNDLSSLLADAEEFAHLLDENEESGTSTSFANRDKASAKQLKWEAKRDDFMTGKKWRDKKKTTNKFKKTKFGNFQGKSKNQAKGKKAKR